MFQLFHKVGALGTCGCGHWHPSFEKKGVRMYFANLAIIMDERNEERILEFRQEGGQMVPVGEPFVADADFKVGIDPSLVMPIEVEGESALLAIVTVVRKKE